jgi:hypothetical protein
MIDAESLKNIQIKYAYIFDSTSCNSIKSSEYSIMKKYRFQGHLNKQCIFHENDDSWKKKNWCRQIKLPV